MEARYGPSWRTPDHQAVVFWELSSCFEAAFEARELAEKYPTLEEAKTWSANMLLLRAAQQDVLTGCAGFLSERYFEAFRRYRLLERASVDYKTGDIVVRGMGQERPHSLAKKVVLEDFVVADGKAFQFCFRSKHIVL